MKENDNSVKRFLIEVGIESEEIPFTGTLGNKSDIQPATPNHTPKNLQK